ncbi:MAG: hypothetical protein U5L45_11375 [Saprospiraceae bacterium]|nr:hypothetical protein [Saprospiraceae bacterium]
MQKTLLGYAHPSIIFLMIQGKIEFSCLLLAQRQEKRWFIFRLRRKMNHIPLSARAKRAHYLESLKR